jgi:hypothetical protein
MTRSSLEVDVVADGRRDFDVVSGDVEIHDGSLANGGRGVGRPGPWGLNRFPQIDRRDVERLAVLGDRAPRHDDALLAEDFGNLASERGFLPSSAPTSCLISARIAVEEAAPPVSVATWLPKKYFSSKMPRGVAMYFCVVTRETVDSCSRALGDLAQGERPHRHLAVLEELALAVDDGLRDPLDRVEALLHVLDQPLRFLQLAGQARAARPCRMSA